MDLKIDDKVAIVTGAAHGIGRAIALRLAEEGAIVIGADLEGVDVERVIAEITSTGGKGLALQIDATDKQAVYDMVRQVLKAYGQIDILVNNVGGGGGSALVINLPAEEWERTIAVNLRSAFLCSQAVARQMIKRKAGRIVNIASISGKEGVPNLSAYSSSKAAVIAFTKVLAKEVVKENIIVNSIAPAQIETELLLGMTNEKREMLRSTIPMGRSGKPEEVAALVKFLVSDECSFSTGQCYDLSGGRAVY